MTRRLPERPADAHTFKVAFRQRIDALLGGWRLWPDDPHDQYLLRAHLRRIRTELRMRAVGRVMLQDIQVWKKRNGVRA